MEKESGTKILEYLIENANEIYEDMLKIEDTLLRIGNPCGF